MKKRIGSVLVLGWAMTVGAAELSVDFTFSASDVSQIPSGEYTVIGLADGMRPVDEVGAPSIPAKFANILLPAGAQNVKISASGDRTLLADGIIPYPAQPRSPKSKPRAAFVPANSRYASAEPWPAEVATYQGDQDMQGYRFVSVRVNPLAYVGAEKKLYLREKVTVTVSYDVSAAPRTISSKQKSEFEPLVDSLVVNPGAAAAFAPQVRAAEPKAAVDYLIITSAALSNAFQQIANYRSSAAGGSYTTRVLTTNTIGSDFSGADIQAKIRACISNSVATLGTTMVLLGGDDTVVLDRNCYVAVDTDTESEMPTDLYYSGLNGNWNADGDSIYGETTDGVDMAWDVVVARLPMRTATQVTNYLDKVMAYEAGSPAADKIILGGPYAWDVYTGSGRPSDDVTIDGHAGFRSTSPAHTSVSDSEAWLRRLYRDGIRPYWPATVGIICDTLTSWDTTTCGDHLESAANTLSAFNKNWTHLMFSGHGAPQYWGLESGDFTQANAASMTGLAAFVYTDACLTGHFDKNSNMGYTTEPCLAESFLRNTRTLGGAVAYMGCARYGWGEPDPTPADNTANGGPSTVYAYKFYKRMYETTGRTLGVAFAMHKADMIGLSGTDDCERWIQFGMNLLGDPALKMPVAISAPSAPVFGANPGPVSATAGGAMSFLVGASGNPAPTLALQSTTASSGYGFTAGTGQLNYTPPAADVGSRTFTFTASNSEGVATQTVSVTVNAATLAITPATTNVPASASSGRRIAVVGNATWTASTNVPWLAITGGGSGTGNGTVTYSVAANPEMTGRSGTITVEGNGIVRTCTVSQAGVSPLLSIGPTTTNVPSSASIGLQISVAANVSWTASTNASWLWITGGGSGIGNGTVTFGVSANGGTSGRTGTITVAGGGIVGTCRVIQAAAVVSTYYRDADVDGYGNPSVTTTGTSPPAGYVGNSADCDDGDWSIHPGAAEVCGDGVDNNCDGQTDEGCAASGSYFSLDQWVACTGSGWSRTVVMDLTNYLDLGAQDGYQSYSVYYPLRYNVWTGIYIYDYDAGAFRSVIWMLNRNL